MIATERYINNRVYPVTTINGQGGRSTVYPGEVVEGAHYANQVDLRKGLVPYNGPRPAGAMHRVGINTGPIRKGGPDLIPGIRPPHGVEGALATDKIPSFATQDKYLGKTIAEWAAQANETSLIDLSRGQVFGLGQFLGLDISEGASKQDATNCVIDNLNNIVAAKNKPKAQKG